MFAEGGQDAMRSRRRGSVLDRDTSISLWTSKRLWLLRGGVTCWLLMVERSRASEPAFSRVVLRRSRLRTPRAANQVTTASAKQHC